MGDSPEMTIEFLRARLLSERSISRSARQRADQLAKRVVELEEQLRIVSSQRRKAEKAAVEVLAILEREGIGEFSEVIDSSSDRDEAAVGRKESAGDDAGEDRSSTASRVNRSEVEDGYSTTECEVSPLQGQGGSLYWKNDRSCLNPHERRRQYQARHRSKSGRFSYRSESSQKMDLGKSCRKVKPRDKGSASSELGDGGAVGTENERNTSQDADGIQVDDSINGCLDGQQCALEGAFEDRRNDIGTLSAYVLSEHDECLNYKVGDNGIGKDEDMERALEKQAELIGQYQAEENAQREWEERFNNGSYINREPSGALADEFEEMMKVENGTDSSDNKLCHVGKEMIRENVSIIEQTSGNEGNFDSRAKSCTNGHIEGTSPTCIESSSHNVGAFGASANGNLDAFTDQMANDTLHRIHPRKIEGEGSRTSSSNNVSNGNWNQMFPTDGFMENHGVNILSSGYARPTSSQLQAPESKTPLVETPHHNPAPELGGVLDALRRAKVSLSQEIYRRSAPVHSLQLGVTGSHVVATEQSCLAGIPISTAGLFRLPTDALPNSNMLGSNHQTFNPGLPEMLPSNHNLVVASNNIHYHEASAESPSRYPLTRWEVESHLNSGSGRFPSYGSRVPHFRADSTMLGSYSSYQTRTSYGDHRSDAISRDRYSNRTNFREHQ